MLERVIDKLIHVNVDADDVVIRYQEFEKDRGITDLEITDNQKFYIIIEAKRRWVLPGEPQLKLYSERAPVRGFCALKSGRTTREKTSPAEESMSKDTEFCGRCLFGETGLKSAITRQPQLINK